eukprot:TRINITY_DN3207_c1_g1_i1.p1 TRINITY_DN3207_c1_g1~~TRINITY_DN3207_c1_g1_i1.p1  ORF type:complete len:1026 (+),score=236.14 TRINITY_DN3207_c1_g1_i1:144-3221(+)
MPRDPQAEGGMEEAVPASGGADAAELLRSPAKKKIKALEKGCAVNYKAGDGRVRPALVRIIDKTHYPPSYTIEFTDAQGGERHTEHDRLHLIPGQKKAKPSAAGSGPVAGGGLAEAAVKRSAVSNPFIVAAGTPGTPPAAVTPTFFSPTATPTTPVTLGPGPAVPNNAAQAAAQAAALAQRERERMIKEPERKFCAAFIKGERCNLGANCPNEHSLGGIKVPGAPPVVPGGGFSIGQSQKDMNLKDKLTSLYQKSAPPPGGQRLDRLAGEEEKQGSGPRPRSLSQLLQAGAKAEEEKQKRDKELRELREKEKDNWRCRGCQKWNPNSEPKCACGQQAPPPGSRPWRCEACGNFNGRARDTCCGKRIHRCTLDHECRTCNSSDYCGKRNPTKRVPDAKRARTDEIPAWCKAEEAAAGDLPQTTEPVPSPLPPGPIPGVVKRWEHHTGKGLIVPENFAAEVHVERAALVHGDAPTARLTAGGKVTFVITERPGEGEKTYTAQKVEGPGVAGVGALDRVQGWWLRPGGKAPCTVRAGGEVLWEKVVGPKLVLDEASQQVMLNDWKLVSEEHTRGVRKLHWAKDGGEKRTWYGHPWPALTVPLTPNPPSQRPWIHTGLRLVFLMIGEGNMAGRGRAREGSCKNSWVYTERDAWEPCTEPVHPFDGSGQGTGPGVAFARRLSDALPSAGFFLVPCAAAPSSILDWQEGLPLFEAAVARVRLACRACDGGFAGIVCAQGETDACPAAHELCKGYADPLRAMVASFRKRLAAPTAPFIATQLGAYLERVDEPPPDRRPSQWKAVNSAMTSATGRGLGAIPFSASVSAEALGADGMYFDASGLALLGKRLAEQWLSTSALPEAAKYREGKGGRGGQDDASERPKELPEAPRLPAAAPAGAPAPAASTPAAAPATAAKAQPPVLEPSPPTLQQPSPAAPVAAPGAARAPGFPSAPQAVPTRPAPPQPGLDGASPLSQPSSAAPTPVMPPVPHLSPVSAAGRGAGVIPGVPFPAAAGRGGITPIGLGVLPPTPRI